MSIIIKLIIFSPICIFSQYNAYFDLELFSPSVIDARSISMGRTSIASAIGSNSIFSNPAIISSLDTRQLQVGARMLMGEVADEEFEDYYDVYNYEFTPNYVINHASASTPFKLSGANIELALGIGYRAYFDWNSEKKIERTYPAELDMGNDEYEIKITGGLFVITPTISVNLNDRFFVGVTLNKSIDTGIELESKYNYEDVEESEQEIEHKTSFLKFGGLAKISNELTVGFSYTPEFEWEWEKIKTTDYDGDVTEYELDIIIPPMIGFGATYQVSPDLLVAYEYQNRNFSDIEAEEYEIYSEFKDGNCHRIGAELKGGSILFRVGYFSDEVLAWDNDDDEFEPLTGFTGGIGFNLGSFFLDLYTEYSSISVDIASMDEMGNMNAESDWSMELFKFGLSASIKL